jgi:hypothetical protein
MSRFFFVTIFGACSFVGCTADVFMSGNDGDPGDAQGETLAAMDGDSMDGDTADVEAGKNDDSGDGSYLDATGIDVADGGDAEDSGINCSTIDVESCAHSPCVTGVFLITGCDLSGPDLVSAACVHDSSCCQTAWSAACVIYVKSLGSTCNGC